YDVQVPPPLIGMPDAFFHVDMLSGDAPSGPRIGSPSALGIRKNSQTILPVFASSANMCPLPPLKSPPALPTKRSPRRSAPTAPTRYVSRPQLSFPKFACRS